MTLLAFLMLAAAAPGAERSAPPPAVQAALDCQAIAADAERLRCLDAAMVGLGAAVREGRILVVDRETVAAARKAAFGLASPRLGPEGGVGEPLDRVEGALAAARQDPVSRLWTFELADGSLWRQISGEGDMFAPPGERVEVRHGALGSFWLKVGARPSVKVHRER